MQRVSLNSRVLKKIDQEMNYFFNLLRSPLSTQARGIWNVVCSPERAQTTPLRVHLQLWNSESVSRKNKQTVATTKKPPNICLVLLSCLDNVLYYCRCIQLVQTPLILFLFACIVRCTFCRYAHIDTQMRTYILTQK